LFFWIRGVRPGEEHGKDEDLDEGEKSRLVLSVLSCNLLISLEKDTVRTVLFVLSRFINVFNDLAPGTSGQSSATLYG